MVSISARRTAIYSPGISENRSDIRIQRNQDLPICQLFCKSIRVWPWNSQTESLRANLLHLSYHCRLRL